MQMQAIAKHVRACTFIGVDLETTGLDEKDGHILEYAVVALDASLKEISRIEGVLPIEYIPSDVSEYVRQMHCENGLWNECISLYKSGNMCQDPEQRIIQFIKDQEFDTHKGKEVKPVILGSSIGFDIRWMNHHWPNVMPELHYRQVDVSTCYVLRGIKNPLDESSFTWPHGAKHRAMWDIQRSIFLAKQYQEKLVCGS